MSDSNFDPNFKWGEMKPGNLSKHIDIKQLRQARSMLADEPIFSSFILNPDISSIKKSESSFLQSTKRQNFKKETSSSDHQIYLKSDKQTQIKLQPSIDSYVINTIKLNRILNSGLGFDKIEHFSNNRQSMNNNAKNNDKKVAKQRTIRTDNDARINLKQFITVMSIHSGFIGEIF